MTIHLSDAAHRELLMCMDGSSFAALGKRAIKGKGTMETFLAKVWPALHSAEQKAWAARGWGSSSAWPACGDTPGQHELRLPCTVAAGHWEGIIVSLFYQAGSWLRCASRTLLTQAKHAQHSSAHGSFLATVGLLSAGVSPGAAGRMLAWADCVALLANDGPVCCQGHSTWQIGTRQAALPRRQLTHRLSKVVHAEGIAVKRSMQRAPASGGAAP